ncbi:MAG: beta-ketoacyl synthase N-terminal-like domain-containing protein [Verrucomicrobiia bacterium]
MLTNSFSLAVCGQGAVTPNGLGVSSLLQSDPWPLQKIVSLTNPDKTFPVYSVNLKEEHWKPWQQEPRLRRASPLSFFMMEAAHQALSHENDISRKKIGLVAALNTGCIYYSRRFFQGILEQGQRFASPALFPETVFNSPLSHVAAVLGVKGACYSIVGDHTAWATAIQIAKTWLQSYDKEKMEKVLVLGAEELDPIACEAYHLAGWFKKGWVPAEGAGALLLKRASVSDKICITQIHEGYPYRNRQQAKQQAQALLEKCWPHHKILTSAQRNWFHSIETASCKSSQILTPSHAYCGEGFTASAAWHSLRAITHLTPKTPSLFQPIWGLNQQISALEFALSCDRLENASSQSR